jgi:hypothetical protein
MLKLASRLGAAALFVAGAVAPIRPVSANADAIRPQDYVTDEDVLINTPNRPTISAFLARPRDASRKLPAALQFTIYAVDVPISQ